MTARSFSYAPAVLVALWTTSTVGLGPDIDPTWLSFDAPAKTVRFQLIAGLTGLNGALNFNGFRDGGLTLVVPAGWRTEIDFPSRPRFRGHSRSDSMKDSCRKPPTRCVSRHSPRASI